MKTYRVMQRNIDQIGAVNNKDLIKKKLQQCLTTADYKRGKSQSYYRFENEIVIYYLVERPSVMTYLWLCFYPMYMPPCPMGIIPFGNRLSYITKHQIWNIRNYEDEESIDKWCEAIAEFDRNHVVPFATQISSPSCMRAYYESSLHGNSSSRLINLPSSAVDNLVMHTYLYSHQYEKAILLADNLLTMESSDNQQANRVILENCKMVIDIASTKDDEYVDKVIDSWKDANRKRFKL